MIKTYKDLKGRTWDQPGAPKWIFRTGNETVENLHPEIADIYNTQLKNNPDYELFYFTREDRLQFIEDQNDDELLLAYNTIIPEAFKADIFRYTILDVYGGVYMDFSMQTLVPFADIIKDYTYVYVKDTAGDHPLFKGLYTAFIITPKNNGFLKAALKQSIYNIKHRIYGITCLTVTSPHMLGQVYREFHGLDSIVIGPRGNDTIVYDHRLPNKFIEDGDINLVSIKHPKHYEILYSNGERYDKLWEQKRMFTPRKIKTFKDLKDKKWEGDGIPKWIFKTGPHTEENIPELMRKIYESILDSNGEYELFYFSDEDCIESIKHHYGDEYVNLHQKLIPTAYQADFWRYLILNQYGGCYGDYSQIPLVSYNEIIEGVDRVFVRDDPSNYSFLYNAVMCCKPNDSVISRAIDICVDNIRNNRYGNSTLYVTGPGVLGQAFLQRKFNLNPNVQEISLGKYKGSNILQHRHTGGFVCDKDSKNVFITKLANHNGFVYGANHDNLHYDKAWREGRVYKY